MPTPATTGQLRTRIDDMQIGDYIVCNYQASSGTFGTFSNFGGVVGTEIPVTGSTTPNGAFYFIMVAKSNKGGLLVADRVIQHSINWDTLNAAKVIQGRPQTFDSKAGIIRSLTGGVAYADSSGNKSLTDQGYGGWPVNNEWDRFIVGFPQELIQPGKTLDDVFHWSGVRTITQDTPIISINTNDRRVTRGSTLLNVVSTSLALSTANTAHGFRPVFEYIE